MLSNENLCYELSYLVLATRNGKNGEPVSLACGAEDDAWTNGYHQQGKQNTIIVSIEDKLRG
jgi:hypothetical protein